MQGEKNRLIVFVQVNTCAVTLHRGWQDGQFDQMYLEKADVAFHDGGVMDLRLLKLACRGGACEKF